MDKGIFITWDFWKQKGTSISEKAILIEINNLSMLEHGCIASNSHFAETMGIKKEAVSRLISSLEKKGYLETKIKNGSRNFSRTITINKMLFDPKQNVISPLTNCLETKGNKTINKSNTKSTALLDEYLQSDSSCTELTKNKAIDFIDYRKKIKKPLKTIAPLTAYIKTLRELIHEDVNIDEAIAMMKEREWQTLKVEYVLKEKKSSKVTSNFITTEIEGY